VLAKRFSFVVIVILLHTLVKIVKIVRSYHCLFVCCSYFYLLLFLLPFVVNKDVDNVLDLSLRPSVRPIVRLFVSLLPTCERYTSKTNEPISIKLSINLAPPGGGGKDTNGRLGYQEVKGQGHKKPKLYVEAWRRHHFRTLEWSR